MIEIKIFLDCEITAKIQLECCTGVSILKRRDFLRLLSTTSAAQALAVRDHRVLAESLSTIQGSASAGEFLGNAEFMNEGPVEMNTPFGSELDGRLFTSMDSISERDIVTPADHFYLRTRASQLLPDANSWVIAVDGLVAVPTKLKIQELQIAARPMGLHLMECAGNTRAARFGMISVGEWAGIPVEEILNIAKPTNAATQVLVSGFDRYATNSVTSIPGASWIFRLDQLLTAGAFLATKLNSEQLSKDHGAPVRLVVPGWYGCACIKWVDQISLLDDSAAATSQMQEYASRTHQNGVPPLAKDFLPPRIDHAAMPVRVEKWRVKDTVQYRVVGLLWGGAESVRALGIRFNPEEDYVVVETLATPQKNPWTIWQHTWKPAAPGRYTIRLAVRDPELHPKRLESGYYARTVEITEV